MQGPFSRKLSSYLGLMAAVFLGVVFLYPQKGSLFFKPIHITPIDNDGISLLIQQSNPSFLAMARAERFKNECLPQPPPYAINCDFVDAAPSVFDLIHLQHDFEALIPNFSSDLQAAIDGAWDDVKVRALQEKAIAVYPKALASHRFDYIVLTVTAHLLFIGLLIALLFWRQPVGRFLIFLVLFPFKLLFKSAAEIHRKV